MSRKKMDSERFRITDEEYDKLVSEGARPGITKNAAAFHALLGRCLGLDPAPPTDAQMPFLKEFSDLMQTEGEKEGWDLRENVTI